jgi:hypothetical protein
MSLFDAVMAGDEDPNPLGDRGRTPLMEAAQAGHEKIVQVLLAGGAEPMLTDNVGETALVIAAAHNHPAVCKLLLPHAREDERDLAQHLLKTAGGSILDVRPGPPPEEPGPSENRRKLASAGAYVAEKLGDDGPMKRLGRLLRSEKGRK